MGLPVIALTPQRQRPDWYIVDDAKAQLMVKVAHLPGISWTRGQISLHRSHLPSLQGVWDVRGATIDPDPVVPTTEGVVLRPHQVEGIKFCTSRRGAMLAWTMRTGKTVPAIYSHDPDTGPLIVAGPLSSRMVWVDWMRKRWPDEEPFLVKGLKYDRDRFLKSKLIFCHYEVIFKHQTVGRRPGTLVLDESHLLANPRAKRTEAVLLYASLAHKVIALSGTPKWNNAKGLWAQLAACNPAAWGRFWEFGRRYCGPIETEHGVAYEGTSNEAEFKERAAETISVKTWAEVAPDLPPLTRSIEIIPVSKQEARKLEIAVEEDLQNKHRAAIADQSTFRLRCADLKVGAAVEIAKEILNEGQPVILWVHHRKVGRYLYERLPGSVLVTGDIPIDEREEIIRKWQRGTVPNAIIISLAVGQVAIDLSRASHEIFVELDWTPGVIAQAEMRPFSIAHPVSATYLVADHPIEREMIEAIVRKNSDTQNLGLQGADIALALKDSFGVDDRQGDMNRLASLFDSADYVEGY